MQTNAEIIARLRADIDAAKIRAMDNFERTWGTRDARAVYSALAKTIPNSASPADAARKARALIAPVAADLRRLAALS